MAEAKMHSGKAIVAYVDGHAVDSEGNVIPGAPKQPKDTDPRLQPGANGLVTPEERSASLLANAIASAMGKTPAKAAPDPAGATHEDSEEDDGTLPTLADLPDHLAGITDVDELKALRRRDKRVGARGAYKARLDELEA